MTPDVILPVHRLRKERVPIRVLIEEKLETMGRDWIPREQTPDLAALRALDYEEEYLRMSEWMRGLLTDDPFPPEVNGLYIGFLFPPPNDGTSSVATFLAGSRRWGEDRDWARKAECPEDRFIDHSPLLLEAYRIILAADHCGDARERAIVFCHFFVSLVVAEWTCTPLRHLLRGGAEVRGLFVGFDSWMGFNIEALQPDRPGGSGSVVVSWRGAIADGRRRAEWLTSVREVANWHEAQWNAVDTWEANRFAALAKLRGAPEVPERPPLRWFEGEISGRILVDPDVVGEDALFRREAERGGRLEEVEVGGGMHMLLRLERLGVAGVDCRAFDLRGLYPTEDRFSFVLLESPEAPFLNGRVAALDDRSFNRKAYAAPVAVADWYVQSPSVHLRDHFEEWTAEWLAWLRFFFAPDFQYHHREHDAFAYARYRTAHELNKERFGREKAMALGLRKLYLSFQAEAVRMMEMFEG